MSNVLILGLSGLGLLVALALAGVALTKRRVPLVAWVAFPAIILGVGAAGTYMGAGEVIAQLAQVPDAQVPDSALAGLWQALAADTASRWAAAGLLALSAVFASVGAFAAGDDTRMTPIAGTMAGVWTLIGVVSTGAYVYAHNIPGGYWLVGVLAVGGVGVTFGAFRRALDEQAQRVAAMRFASTICLLIGVSAAGKAVVLGSDVAAFGPNGPVALAGTLAEAITTYSAITSPAYNVGWIAFAFALVVAFFGVFYELSDVVERATVWDVWATLAVLGVLGLVRGGEYLQTSALTEIGTNAPAVAVFGELGSDLPAGLLTIEKVAHDAYPSDGGFGDVLVWRKLNDEDEDAQWIREFAWDGSGWTEDESPLATVQLHPRRPLLGISTGGDVASIQEALERTTDGRALLLLRGGQSRGDAQLPATLAHRQVSYLELQLGTEDRDLTEELWVPAGFRHYNWGPTAWFGEAEGEEPLIYADAVAADTSATTLHVVLPEERGRVSDIVHSCLPWVMTQGEEGVERSGRTCLLTTDTVHELRQAAADAWPLPEPEHFRLTARRLAGDHPEESLVTDRLQRETAAIDYCIGILKEEGESEVGVLRLETEIDSRGRLTNLTIHDRSRVQSQPIARCAALRFRHIEFEMPEEPELEEGAEAPPRPLYEVNIDLRR